MPDSRITSIPFSGFYNSWHDSALDDALTIMCSDENGDIIDSRYSLATNAIDWRIAHLAYAQLYCERLATACNATWQFAKLDSPRFDNYRTDEIDVTIDLPELQRMHDAIDPVAFAALVQERLAPRSGFIPFYSADLSEWGNLSEWESPQLSLLVEAYCDMYETAESRDCWLVDDSNGDITRCIESAIPADALNKIYEE